jgi:hypothetical protein
MNKSDIVKEIKVILEDVILKSIDPKPEDDMEEDDMEEETEGCECEGCTECKSKGGCTEKMCQGHKGMKKSEDLSDEEISKSYNSDNEEEDKWDNIEKACWSGYTQRGMKDKNGKKVPNCVPIKKSLFGSEGPQTLVPKNNK